MSLDPNPTLLDRAFNKTQSAYPWLWDGLLGMWVPALGKTGLTLDDVSGRKNHGTLENMDPATDWVVDGEVGRALQFDGGGTQSVLTPLFVDPRNPISMSVLIKFDAIAVDNIVGARTIGSDRFYIGIDGTTTFFGVGDSFHEGAANVLHGMSANTWYLLTLTVDGSTARYFVNGTEKDSFSYTASAAIDRPLMIGKMNDGSSTFDVDGLIASTAVWGRVLLPSEIRQLADDHLAPLRLRDTRIPIAAAGAILTHPGMAGGMQIMSGGMRG